MRAHVVLLAALALGCEREAQRYNASGAERDVAAMAKRHGVTLTKLECSMIGETRGVTCLTTTTPVEAASLATGLALHAPPSKTVRPAAGGCASLPRFSGPTVDVLTSERRSDMLVYVILYVDTATRATCIETEYGYG